MGTPLDLWHDYVSQIKEPPPSRRVWAPPSPGAKLSVVLVEFRPHRWVRPVLWNMAHVYGGTDAALYIVHGTGNEAEVKSITRDWSNVQCIRYPHHNIDMESYQNLCCNPAFYAHFQSEYLLRFEIDTLIRRPIDPVFFDYDYVGAPWTDKIREWYREQNGFEVKKRVGNAGFSLQRIAAMVDIVGSHPRPAGLAYDVHVTNLMRDEQLPDHDLARSFSVEFEYHDNPSGLHKCWDYHPIDKVEALLKNLPGH